MILSHAGCNFRKGQQVFEHTACSGTHNKRANAHKIGVRTAWASLKSEYWKAQELARKLLSMGLLSSQRVTAASFNGHDTMDKIDLPTLPHDTVEISDRLVSIGERLGVTAMAVKGIAAENQDESAYAISNLIFEVREELEDISINICSSVVAMRK